MEEVSAIWTLPAKRSHHSTAQDQYAGLYEGLDAADEAGDAMEDAFEGPTVVVSRLHGCLDS